MPTSSTPTVANARYQDGASVKLTRTINGVKLGKDNTVVKTSLQMPAGSIVKVFPGSILVIPPGDTSISEGASLTEEEVEFVCRIYAECDDGWIEKVFDKIDPWQARMPHKDIALAPNATPSEEAYTSGQLVYFVGSKSFQFKSDHRTKYVQKGDCLRLASRAVTQTGGAPRALSIKNAYYAFEIVTEKEHKYVWKSAHDVNQRDLAPL